MNERTLTRRRFTLAAGSAAAVGLAGCADDENGEDEENGENGEAGEENGDNGLVDDEDEEAELIVSLENEDGEPVSMGIEISIQGSDNAGLNVSDADIEGGEYVPEGGLEAGDYTITVESVEDEFESQEEEVTLESGEEEEIDFVLEGATGDDEVDEDEENGEEEEDDD